MSVWPYGLRRGTVCFGEVREGVGVDMDVELGVRGRSGSYG